jgi:hypothetical protein
MESILWFLKNPENNMKNILLILFVVFILSLCGSSQIIEPTYNTYILNSNFYQDDSLKSMNNTKNMRQKIHIMHDSLKTINNKMDTLEYLLKHMDDK